MIQFYQDILDLVGDKLISSSFLTSGRPKFDRMDFQQMVCLIYSALKNNSASFVVHFVTEIWEPLKLSFVENNLSSMSSKR